MSTIRVQIKWDKINTGKCVRNLSPVLCIQTIPVAIIKYDCTFGYFIQFIMDKKRKPKYYAKEETAKRNVEKQFGMYSDRFGDLCLIEDKRNKDLLKRDYTYSSFSTKVRKKIKGISEKRIQNLRNSMPVIFWDEKTIKITVKGYGDRPAFTIKGTYSMPGGITFSILWHSSTPGGGESRIYHKGKRYKANLTTGMNIINNLIKLEEIQKMKPEKDTIPSP